MRAAKALMVSWNENERIPVPPEVLSQFIGKIFPTSFLWLTYVELFDWPFSGCVGPWTPTSHTQVRDSLELKSWGELTAIEKVGVDPTDFKFKWIQ